MTVWIVMRGEYSEGGSIKGVFATEALAIGSAESVKPCLAPWTKTGPREWQSGCDWLTVEPYPVHGGGAS